MLGGNGLGENFALVRLPDVETDISPNLDLQVSADHICSGVNGRCAYVQRDEGSQMPGDRREGEVREVLARTDHADFSRSITYTDPEVNPGSDTF